MAVTPSGCAFHQEAEHCPGHPDVNSRWCLVLWRSLTRKPPATVSEPSEPSHGCCHPGRTCYVLKHPGNSDRRPSCFHPSSQAGCSQMKRSWIFTGAVIKELPETAHHVGLPVHRLIHSLSRYLPSISLLGARPCSGDAALDGLDQVPAQRELTFSWGAER